MGAAELRKASDGDLSATVRRLARENEALRKELTDLRGRLGKTLADADGAYGAGPHASEAGPDAPPAVAGVPCSVPCPWTSSGHGLSQAELHRYSRQIILDAFGPDRQAQLLRSSALIVGAGGLGCPAAIYLASMGVGRLGIVDRDSVEESNLHRQVAHREADVGRHKAESVASCVFAINSSCAAEVYRDGLTPANAVDLVSRFDVVIDASDNAPTRYLANDACVAAGRPLVSGAAIGMDGQLSVYHFRGGPCYRCLHPVPPRPADCARCSDAGVMGAVPGVIGVLQAVEVVKVLTGVGEPLAGRLLVMDAARGTFRTVKLRGRDPSCAACGSAPTARDVAGYDYRAFTGQDMTEGRAPDVHVLPASERVSPEALRDAMAQGGAGGGGNEPDATAAESAERDVDKGAGPTVSAASLGTALRHAASAGRPVVLDVRPACQFAIARLAGSVSAPLSGLWAAARDAAKQAAASPGLLETPLVALCRRGNDSQLAVLMLREAGFAHVTDVAGGLEAWRATVDPTFPDH